MDHQKNFKEMMNKNVPIYIWVNNKMVHIREQRQNVLKHKT